MTVIDPAAHTILQTVTAPDLPSAGSAVRIGDIVWTTAYDDGTLVGPDDEFERPTMIGDVDHRSSLEDRVVRGHLDEHGSCCIRAAGACRTTAPSSPCASSNPRSVSCVRS